MDVHERGSVELFLPGDARLESVESDRREWQEEDPLGNPGTTCVETTLAVGRSRRSGEELESLYRGEGFEELPQDSHREDDCVRLQRILTDPANPFLLDHVVQVGLGWRKLTTAHRGAVEGKIRTLREQIGGTRLRRRRRDRAESMLADLEDGLLTRIHVESCRRIFHMEPVIRDSVSLGHVVPLEAMDQLVYVVDPLREEDADDEPAEPMYLTILGADEVRVSFLFSGGILGQRTVTNLEASPAHNAWFQNRQSVLTEDTAPWVSRRILRDLLNGGTSEIVVRSQRDESPIRIRRTGEETHRLKTGEGHREVPVIVAQTEKGDRLWILRDEESPLVMKMEETGADLLRSVVEVRRLDAL